MKIRSLTVLLCVWLFLGGCATAGSQAGTEAFEDQETWDPFEPFNRAMFKFNDTVDAWLLKPVSRGYDWLLPGPIKSGVGNFFSNLVEPRTVLNDLLQGKWARSGRDTGRFIINSTAGILGVMDVAKHVGLETQPEDFGQTFAVWGVGEGPYFVWPIIGPRFLRETVGFGFDWVSNPMNWPANPNVTWGLWTVDIVDTRARLLPTDAIIERAAGGDKYIFIREAYRQRRRNLVYDGNPPKPKFFEEEPENNKPVPAAPPAKPDTAPPADPATP